MIITDHGISDFDIFNISTVMIVIFIFALEAHYLFLNSFSSESEQDPHIFNIYPGSLLMSLVVFRVLFTKSQQGRTSLLTNTVP